MKQKIMIIVNNLYLCCGGLLMMSPLILLLYFLGEAVITASSQTNFLGIIIGGLMYISSAAIIFFILRIFLQDAMREWDLCNKIGKCSKCKRQTSEYELYISDLNPKKDLCWKCKEKEDKKFQTHWLAYVD